MKACLILSAALIIIGMTAYSPYTPLPHTPTVGSAALSRSGRALSYEHPAKLEDTVRTVNLQYIMWACACANWIEADRYELYEDSGTLAEHAIFIEPAAPALKLPDTLGYNADLIQFTGSFYTTEGYPNEYMGTETEEEPVGKARVFRYTRFRVIKSNFRTVVGDTL